MHLQHRHTVTRLGWHLLRLGVVALSSAVTAFAQHPDVVRVSALLPRFYLVSNATGNLVVYVEDTLSMVAGTQAPALVRRAKTLLDSLHAPRVRYALILESDSAQVFADGGWGQLGALTISDENLRLGMLLKQDSIRRQGKTPPLGSPSTIGFSDVIQLYLAHEEPHIAHRPRGITSRDVLIHFEGAHFLMMGNLITPDEYPLFANGRRRHVTNLLNTMDWFTDSLPKSLIQVVVPGRGRLLQVEDLREYRRVLSSLTDRIAALQSEGKSDDIIVAAHPSHEFDERWGHGRVSPDEFVRSLSLALRRP